MKHFFTGLWRHTNFLKLWAGQTISLLGDQITKLAVPVAATLTLHATALQMGLLSSISSLPKLLFGLFVGVWIDRQRRRPLLIAADLGRALLLGSIPIAALLGLLSMGQLYIVVFLAGMLTLVFDVAHISLLPSVLPAETLVDGNSKLEISRSGALIAGPGVAGLLVQLVTAPFAIVLDAFSFLGSAAFLSWTRVRESRPPSKEQQMALWSDIQFGIRTIIRHPVLRPLAASLATFNFFLNMFSALYVLYVLRVIRISPSTLGVIYAIGNVGFLAGALLTGWVMRRFGTGPTIIWGACISDAGYLLIVLVKAPGVTSILLLIAIQFVTTFAGPITAITQQSLRQAITPLHLQGRINGAMRFLSGGIGPIGALVAGVLGEHIGLRSTMLIAVIGIQSGFFVLLASPLHRFRDLPTAPENI